MAGQIEPRTKNRKWFWKGCKPNFVFPEKSGERIICLSSQYPGPVSLSRNLERAAPGSPIWPCTRWGLPCLVAYAPSGGLLPHHFTLTDVSHETPAVYSLLHCPSGRLTASPPACISKSAFLRRQLRVTRHRALWCSDFPPPPNCFEGKRSSALPKPAQRILQNPVADKRAQSAIVFHT